VKNKVAPPFTECEFDILYNEGISGVGSLLDLAIEQNVVEKKGAWLYYEGAQIAQGRDAALNELKTNAELFAKVEAATKEKIGVKSPEAAPAKGKALAAAAE